MLDINLLLEDRGGIPEAIKESQRRHSAPVEIIDEVIAEYKAWTTTQFDSDQKNKEMNALQKEIGKKYKSKEDPSGLLAKKAELQKDKEELVAKAKEQEISWKNKLNLLRNIVHDSVPTSMDKDNNEIIRTYFHNGIEPVKKTDILSHHEVLTRLDGYDQERGAKVAGHRGYFLASVGVDLNLALIRYGLNFLDRHGHKKLQTPFFMNKDMIAKTAQLSQFDEELYKINILYMQSEICTCWVTLPVSVRKLVLMVRIPGGIFRVHQFEKIEQFVLTAPEKSWEMFNEMIEHSEEFFQSLGLSYRVVAIVSGALNNAAAKKYDLEAWFPYQGEYKELVSCSNRTDYQSRNLEIRCSVKKMSDREKKHVRCLNSTLCATERATCALLESWQREDGLEIPPPLVPYMDGQTFIPYIKPAPKPTPKK
ncbi:seryl-tRNA synthetase [Rhizopus delemar RA 99-880]|uniref:serine--tRNA ligase n=3 Tax=Rhizopus TaxID=4842 RepID=I1CQK9_RHIO9|nr:seryl-tRNA synthetase [Rhizopus delemar RA 99-880]|eukprot:EIE90739.1 seryl-tRNA synthetase [Rhizopus delemar RA 99-880]